MAPHMADVYHPGGKRPGYGDIFKNPLLAKSLKAIAQDGPAAFYEGEIAEQIVAKSKELGGRMALKDLKDHTANWVEPVSSNYRGWDVWEIPPNGQGIARTPDPQHPRAVRHWFTRSQLRRTPAPVHRSQEAGF